MKNLINTAWRLIQENRPAYILLNAAYYGLVVVFMIYAAFNQPLQHSLIEAVGAAFMTGPLSIVGQSYVNAQVLTAILVTFLINLLIGAFATITLPALVIPFSGILVGFFRAAMWGLILSPANPDLRLLMIPHSITLIVEGQAYILTMLAAYAQGRAFLWPRTVSAEGHGRGYVEGLRRTLKIYILVVLALIVAAFYEVIEVVIAIKFF
jgi:hypothetical protein